MPLSWEPWMTSLSSLLKAQVSNTLVPGKLPPGKLPPRNKVPVKIAPKEQSTCLNCPQGTKYLFKLPPGKLPPRNKVSVKIAPKEKKVPVTIAPWKVAPKEKKSPCYNCPL